MPIKIRPNPAIPDHEVLRKIGGGAYGEVWLARGVTGALRAVKVVWREDFEDARGFEREFEGILKFEPMSRDHPALVNILHVGRSPDGVSFYYYVMELGDDVATGQEINAVEYEPRTLRADTQQGAGVQWDTNVCIDVGLRLAEALDHLHERGLAHRDVKPSNVIFVNGRAKLADIGLVAMRGQRTFVGTEGFVPPEGPGSAQADVYSLGKVLYEIATGKDRLSFPELPDSMPTGIDRKRWLDLNKIICDICEPRISKRKISTAAQLADALRRLQRGKRRRRSGLAVWMTTLVLVLFAGWASWEMVKESDWVRGINTLQGPPKPQVVQVRVNSAPEGAEVFDQNNVFLGMSNNYSIQMRVGEKYHFKLKKSGFKDADVEGTVPSEPHVAWATLENFSPPPPGEKWSDHLGVAYLPEGQEHVSSGFITKRVWTRFLDETKYPADKAEFLEITENGKPVQVALVAADGLDSFRKWFYQGGHAGGYLTNDHEVVLLPETSFANPAMSDRARNEGLRPFRIKVCLINYGQITLTTDPSGVEVYANPVGDPASRVSRGYTSDSLLIDTLRPGRWQLYLVIEGYKTQTIELDVGEGEKVTKSISLEKNLGVVFGKPWENELGMKFVPVGPELMVSAWETRVQDYELFVKEADRPPANAPYFQQAPDHPVVNVSRADAQAFCKWLTERERKHDRITPLHEYRLPTDLEWSAMAGLSEELGISPGWRDARKSREFPFGPTWVGTRVGNFADLTASTTGIPVERTIPDYDDGFAYTAPVGSFLPNQFGLYDLSGNVQEWVADEYSNLGKDLLGVLRGGGWNTYQPENLYTGSRNAVPPDFQDAIYGFRVVLAKVPPKTD